MYNYKPNKEDLYIEIQTTIPRQRIALKLKDRTVHSGNLRDILNPNNTLVIHSVIKTKVKPIWQNTDNVFGIDKGYNCLLSVSNNKFYGEGLNHLLSQESDRVSNLNRKRNKLYALVKKYEEEGNHLKAQNIRKYNLGKIKYNNKRRKAIEKTKSFINQELNKFFRENKPYEIVLEDLTFVSWKDKIPKHIKRRLSAWIKGYLRDRLEYKCSIFNVKQTIINPAYTSLICSKCGRLGKRNGDIFDCSNCGKLNADYNASINILNRKYNKEITLKTPYKKVKDIIIKRIV